MIKTTNIIITVKFLLHAIAMLYTKFREQDLYTVDIKTNFLSYRKDIKHCLLIFSGETSSNRDIFFTDDAAKKFFPTSEISAQEIHHQFFLIWSNLTIMAHIMGLGNQSESWKIIILS